MVRLFRAALVSVALFAPALAAAAEAEAPYVQATGTARSEIAFDRAIVPFTLRAEGANADDVSRELGDKSRQIVDALSQIGVTDPNLRINGPLLSVIYASVTDDQGGRRTERPKPDGVRGEVVFRVTTTDFKKIPKILSTASGAGALLSSPTFEVADLAGERRRLALEALRSALAHARELAEASGGHAGRVLSVIDQRGGRPPADPRTLALAGNADAEFPVLPGRATLEHSVTVRVEIVQP
jgi:uncharacterized protein YggE